MQQYVRFDVPGNADLYTITFTAAASSMSLDRVAVDTFWTTTVFPEPGWLAVIAFGAIAACRRGGPSARGDLHPARSFPREFP